MTGGSFVAHAELLFMFLEQAEKIKMINATAKYNFLIAVFISDKLRKLNGPG